MDHARALGRLGAGPERPRPRLLVAGGEERAQAEQVVGGPGDAGQRALASPSPSSSSAALVGGELRRLGLELHATRRAPRRAAELVGDRLDELVGVVELVLARLTTASTGLVVSRKNGRSASRCSAVEPGPVQRRARPAARPTAASSAATSPASDLSALAALRRRSSWVSAAGERRPARARARACGGRRAGRCRRRRWGPRTPAARSRMASTSRMPPRNRLPRPSPCAEPFCRPAMSTNSAVAWHDLLRARSSPPARRRGRRAPWPRRCWSRWSRTGGARPTASPPVRALNSADFPALGRPTMPKRSIGGRVGEHLVPRSRMDPVEALDRIVYLLDRPGARVKVKAFLRAAEVVRRHRPTTSCDQLHAEGAPHRAPGHRRRRPASAIAEALDGEVPGYLAELEAETVIADQGGRARSAAALRGDCHTHSTWSDGGAPIETMARAAMALGHEYIVMTDHSPRLTVAHGLSPERLARPARGDRRAQRASWRRSASSPASRSTSSRTARSTSTTTCSPSSTSSWPACTRSCAWRARR